MDTCSAALTLLFGDTIRCGMAFTLDLSAGGVWRWCMFTQRTDRWGIIVRFFLCDVLFSFASFLKQNQITHVRWCRGMCHMHTHTHTQPLWIILGPMQPSSGMPQLLHVHYEKVTNNCQWQSKATHIIGVVYIMSRESIMHVWGSTDSLIVCWVYIRKDGQSLRPRTVANIIVVFISKTY